MKLNREHMLLAIVFVVVLIARLAFMSSEGSFDNSSYFALRQAEHIRQTGLPLFNDPLSYSGRTFIFPPLFHYLLAGLSIVISLSLAAKILTSVLFACLALTVYAIAKYLTKNRTASFLAALFSGLIPAMYSNVNSISAMPLSLLLAFLLSYTFMRLEEKGFATLSIIITVLLLLTEASIFLLLLTFMFYFVVLALEQQSPNNKEVELTVFLFFLSLWFYILVYKKAFFINGLRVIWENMPAPLLSSYFSDINFIGLIYSVGVFSLVLGVYAIYNVFFKTKSRATNLYISFALISFVMLWFKMITLSSGLMFLSTCMIILSSYSIKTMMVSISKTKISHRINIVLGAVVVLFILTSIAPFFTLGKSQAPAQDELSALDWIKENTGPDVVVLGRVEEGFLINYFAQRKNVADTNFLFINNINQRYSDVESMLTIRIKSEAVRLINRYKADYIYLSSSSMEEYNITMLFYADPDCFEKVYDNETMIYRFLGCTIND
ncbi:MAG: hypothetical protein V1866_03000 [archaeon]